MGRPFWLVFLLLASASCGGRSRVDVDQPPTPTVANTGGLGGTNTGGTNTGGTSAGGTSSTGRGSSDAGPDLCPDYIPPVNQAIRCRAAEDCGANQSCHEPGDLPLDCHGSCLTGAHACDTAVDCGQGKVCVVGFVPCQCDGAPPPSSCEVPCSANTCGEFQRCNAESGLCEPWPCTEGFTCYVDDVCDPSNAEADMNGCIPLRCENGYECPENTRCSAGALGHGCAPLPCQSDATCDCGACVNETCVSGPGTCVSL